MAQARQDIAQICTLIDVDAEDAEDMLADIRALTPAPLTPAITPTENQHAADLIFRHAERGGIEVALNEASLPKLLTDDALFSTLSTSDTDKAARAYYRDCYRTAGGFVLAMQKRANTLLRLGSAIAKTQAKFVQTDRKLDRKPLTMGALAKDLGLNKSTISRSLNNCLIETPHGLKPAIDFFVRPLVPGRSTKTREQALARLALLIKTEDRKHPYADDMLTALLSQTNFTISRRTVAKYRGLLNIPNAFQRRRR